MKEKTFDKSGVWPVKLKNPDGKTSTELLLTVRKPGALLLKNTGTSYYASTHVQANAKKDLLLEIQGASTKEMKAFFAGRPLQIFARNATSLTVQLNTQGLTPGTYPLWVWDKDKGASNTMLIVVLPEGHSSAIPKFYSVSPIALDGGAALTPVKGKVRFLIYGSGLTKNLYLVVDKKSYPVQFINSIYSIAEADLTGVAKGQYEIYLKDPNSAYQSPKLKLDVQ